MQADTPAQARWCALLPLFGRPCDDLDRRTPPGGRHLAFCVLSQSVEFRYPHSELRLCEVGACKRQKFAGLLGKIAKETWVHREPS
jgi:hypothetical protein